MEIVKEVKREAPALHLHAQVHTGHQPDDECDIYWDDLRNAEIGTKWSVSGGGSLVGIFEQATLVYRDKDVAVIYYYSEHTPNGEHHESSSLLAYQLRRRDAP